MKTHVRSKDYLPLSVADALGLWQRWDMFGQVAEEYRWLTILIENDKGEIQKAGWLPEFDPQAGRPLSAIYPSEIDRRYHEQLTKEPTQEFIFAYAQAVCRFDPDKKPVAVQLKIGSAPTGHSSAPRNDQVVGFWRIACAK